MARRAPESPWRRRRDRATRRPSRRNVSCRHHSVGRRHAWRDRRRGRNRRRQCGRGLLLSSEAHGLLVLLARERHVLLMFFLVEGELLLALLDRRIGLRRGIFFAGRLEQLRKR